MKGEFRMKKVFLCFMSFLLTLGVLGACGESNTSQSEARSIEEIQESGKLLLVSLVIKNRLVMLIRMGIIKVMMFILGIELHKTLA